MNEYHIKALNTNKTGSKQLHDLIAPLAIRPKPRVGDNFRYKSHVYIIEQIEIKEAQLQ